ncbi:MAG: hypothetical protein JWM59_4045 [Verrucomicrobiales bacterium]|nr:hypothetical protein [Verrucomicrobiales bacterium]
MLCHFLNGLFVEKTGADAGLPGKFLDRLSCGQQFHGPTFEFGDVAFVSLHSLFWRFLVWKSTAPQRFAPSVSSTNL